MVYLGYKMLISYTPSKFCWRELTTANDMQECEISKTNQVHVVIISQL